MPTKTVDVAEAQAHLAELLALVATGTEIVLTQGDTSLARLVPPEAAAPSPAASGKLRIPGLYPGEIWTSDDFDDPLHIDIA